MTKTRVLVLQVNSQLMEAVQQKVALSQQLDQWQQDVQELLSENMTKKMAANRNRNHGNSNSNNNSRSGAESDSSQPEKRKSSRIMSFLKLGSAWHQRHDREAADSDTIAEEEGEDVGVIPALVVTMEESEPVETA